MAGGRFCQSTRAFAAGMSRRGLGAHLKGPPLIAVISAHALGNVAAQEVTKLERVMGIEPTLFAWEARVLPLNDTREAANYRHCWACV